MLPQLAASGLIDKSEIETLQKKLGIAPTDNLNVDCSKYNVQFSRNTLSSSRIKSRRPTETYIHFKGSTTNVSGSSDSNTADLIKSLTKNGLSFWNLTHTITDVPQRPNFRLKRDQNSSNSSKIVGEIFCELVVLYLVMKTDHLIEGVRHKIGCIKRGDPLEKNSDWVSLCDACWVWRKLPTDYFPQYINELVTDTDLKCLSGKCEKMVSLHIVCHFLFCNSSRMSANYKVIHFLYPAVARYIIIV